MPAGLKANADQRVLKIIDYIQANIYFPEKLKAAAVAQADRIPAKIQR
jgi:hypothetical protein